MLVNVRLNGLQFIDKNSNLTQSVNALIRLKSECDECVIIHGNGLLSESLKKRAESRQVKVLSKNTRIRVKGKLYLFFLFNNVCLFK